MIELLILPLFAFLNRLRGGGFFASKLPSRPLYWVAVCVLCSSIAVLPYQDAFVFTLAYFVWGVYAWGRWFDLGNMPELTRPIKPLERVIERISFGSDYIAFGARMAFASPFLAYFGLVYVLLFPLACVVIYEVSWRLWCDNPIPKAELIIGVLWGSMLLRLAR